MFSILITCLLPAEYIGCSFFHSLSTAAQFLPFSIKSSGCCLHLIIFRTSLLPWAVSPSCALLSFFWWSQRVCTHVPIQWNFFLRNLFQPVIMRSLTRRMGTQGILFYRLVSVNQTSSLAYGRQYYFSSFSVFLLKFVGLCIRIPTLTTDVFNSSHGQGWWVVFH